MREAAILSRRAAAALPLAALLGPAAAIMPPAAAGDAALVDLGRRWEAALAAERAHYATYSDAMSEHDAQEHEATVDELHDDTVSLFAQIVATPAVSAAGLVVKGKVLAYENDVEDLNEAAIAAALAGARYFTDRIAFSLALDCIRMARAA